MLFLPDVRMVVRDRLVLVSCNDTVVLLWLYGGYKPGRYCSNRTAVL